MQQFVKTIQNKIFLILTILLIVAIILVIRGCDYPLLFRSDFLIKVFVSNYSEKLFYNLSVSYIVTYVFYVIQLYIPEKLKEKEALQMLVSDMDKELRLVKEFIFLVQHIMKVDHDTTVLYNKNIDALFYKEYYDNSCMLRRFSRIDTLKSNMEDIISVHHQIEGSRYYYDLNSYILHVHTSLPVKEMEAIIDCTIYSTQISYGLQLISDNMSEEISHFLDNMQKVLSCDRKVFLQKCDDGGLIQKYQDAFQISKLNDEYRFMVSLTDNVCERENMIS